MNSSREAIRLMLAVKDQSTVAGLRALKESERGALLALKAEDDATYQIVCAAFMAAFHKISVPMPPWFDDPSEDLVE